MNRRNGIIAMLASAVGLMSKTAEVKANPEKLFDPEKMVTQSFPVSVWDTKSQTLNFNLASFARFNFVLGEETVTLTPEEIMAALKDTR